MKKDFWRSKRSSDEMMLKRQVEVQFYPAERYSMAAVTNSDIKNNMVPDLNRGFSIFKTLNFKLTKKLKP